MDRTLSSILLSINSLKKDLESTLSRSDLGFDTDNLRGRSRESGRGRGAGRGGRPPRSLGNRLGRGVIGGVIGAGLGWGASKLLGVDEDTATALEIGGGVIGAGAGYLPKGGRPPVPPIPPAGPAAEAGGWFGKLGKFFKTTGNIARKGRPSSHGGNDCRRELG